jgi:flagellar hook-associated protein FlgK
MGGFEIGISGLHAAQNALDIIGNNIANAATEGYHRQTVDMRPLDDVFTSGILLGQGVDVKRVKREIDELLDNEIFSKESEIAQINRELESLMTIESAFGELSTSALSTAMDDFFNALHKLSQSPDEVSYKSQVESTARALCSQMQSIGSTVADLESQTYKEAQNVAGDINTLAEQIAELNKKIYRESVKGETPNNMLDQRDRLINELAQLVNVTTYSREHNIKDVSVANIPIVVSSYVTEVEVGLQTNGDNHDLVISMKDAGNWSTEVTGGRLGALFSLRNSILRDIKSGLDDVARSIIFETNNLHVQGVGSYGSFNSLTGWTMATQELSEMDPPITDGGKLYIRVIDDTGLAVRQSITLSTSDTLSDVAADITAMNFDFGAGAVNPLDAQVVGGKLVIGIDSAPAFDGYKYDFIPGFLSAPTSSTFTGGAGGELPPTVEVIGNYSGNSDETYTFTVSGAAAGGEGIGTGSTKLTVTDSGGGTVKVIDIGDGFVAGEVINIADGLKIKLNSNSGEVGYVQNGQDFTVEAIADSDTSGILSATGINTFFSGTGATTMNVCEDIINNLGKIAVARTADFSDSTNALKMGQVGESALSSLGDLTIKEYYRTVATGIGEQIDITKVKEENAYGVWKSLQEQQDDASGVDMNDEATKMLVYERMFQGMAKYMNAVGEMLDRLMTII